MPSLFNIGYHVDHLAHLGGFAAGAMLGFVLSPKLDRATEQWHAYVLEQMSEAVCTVCGSSSDTAERAMLRYTAAL